VGVAGVAHLPDKTPLAGADVVLVMPSQPAFIENGRAPDSIQHRVVKTGADGRFTFPPQEPPYTILVLHDRGFAEQNIDATPASAYNLTIEPWGRIEGTLRIGNRPGAGEPMSLSYERIGDTPKAIPWWSGEATTDGSGHFAFDRVIPSEVLVSRDIPVKRPMGRMTIYRSPSFKVAVVPGERTQVVMGGTGRAVIGKLTASKKINGAVDWTASNNSLIIKPSAAGLLSTALQKLRSTGRGSEVRFASRSYSIVLDRDGSFRVEDVEAGVYDLHVMVDEPPRDSTGFSHSRNILGTARRVVTIPPIPGGRSDEPLDLGTILLKPAKKMVDVKISEPAPAFRIDTVDGKTISLADHRGKYVLLDFWATWCGPCLIETPHLKAVFEAFGKDSRFVMVGLSLDKAQADPRQYAAKHGLGWIQGFLGEWVDGKLPDEYGVRGIPSIWLIGPRWQGHRQRSARRTDQNHRGDRAGAGVIDYGPLSRPTSDDTGEPASSSPSRISASSSFVQHRRVGSRGRPCERDIGRGHAGEGHSNLQGTRSDWSRRRKPGG
jgi:thiol-disulfide isomerase/thioredoxin